MLRMQARQLEAFRRSAALAFEREMVERAREIAPAATAPLSDEDLLAFVPAALARAEARGFTIKGALRLHVELALLFGLAFDEDAELPWARDAVAGAWADPSAPIAQMDRAAALHHAATEALEAFRGKDGKDARAALKALVRVANEPVPEAADDLASFLLAGLARVHPGWSSFVGEAALRELAARAVEEASGWGLHAPREVALVFGLMVAFGQGCVRDPLRPWIAAALGDASLGDASARARRLEEMALAEARRPLAAR